MNIVEVQQAITGLEMLLKENENELGVDETSRFSNKVMNHNQDIKVAINVMKDVVLKEMLAYTE